MAKGIIFTPDSRELLSSSEDGILRLWNVQNGESLQVLHGYSAQLNALSWSPSNKYIACAGVEPILTIHSLNDEAPPHRLHGYINRIYDVEWSPDGHVIASKEAGNLIRLWDAETGEPREGLSYPNDPANHFYGMIWSPDGTQLAAGTARL